MLETTPIILTRPSATAPLEIFGFNGPVKNNLRFSARCIRDSWRQRQSPFSFWGGHSAVTQNLITGIKTSGLGYSFNPTFIQKPESISIGVLAGKNTLEWATRVVGTMEGSHLIVGPNVVEGPLNATDLLRSPSIQTILVPSPWVKDLWIKEDPYIEAKVEVWMSGVDSGFWTPSEQRGLSGVRRILIYVKSLRTDVAEEVGIVCKELNYETEFIHAGRYSRNEYLRALRRSDAMIVVGGFESQGLAMFEAWSADVPTLVWLNPNPPLSDRGATRYRSHQKGTEPSPYLSDETGAFWSSLEVLSQMIEQLSIDGLNPRKWVMKNAQLEQCAERYMDFF